MQAAGETIKHSRVRRARKFFLLFRLRAIYDILKQAILSKLERKFIHAFQPDEKYQSAAQKAAAPSNASSPQRGTLPLLITLSVFVVAMIFFAPKIAQTPAANVSGTEVDEAAVSAATQICASRRRCPPTAARSRMRRARFRIGWKSPTRATAPSTSRATALSDRADKITFVFPDLTLAAGEHVIVFASDSTQNEAGETLHAKFKLSSAGDKLFLFGSDGIAFQELDVPAMDYNMSYTWIGGNDYIITDQYTPGYDNNQEGYAAFRSSTVLQSGALVINEICSVLHHHAQGRRRRLSRLDRDP